MTTATSEEIRKAFDAAVARQADPDKRARMELCREYFLNPEFRAAFADEVARINGVHERALRVIAGEAPCSDSLLGNADIARDALRGIAR